MTMNRNSLLYIAIAIPLFMVIVTIIGVRFYHVELQPKYNYLYAVLSNTDSYQCEQLITQAIYPQQKFNKLSMPSNLTCNKPILYIYNFKNKTSTEISPEQAKKLNLSNPQETPTSPDGYRMQRYCSNYSGSWWWEMSISDTCLKKDTLQTRIILKKYSDQENYTRRVLLGWVLSNEPGKNGRNHSNGR
jgi:hypothetical protein